jgi:hypothetical protein
MPPSPSSPTPQVTLSSKQSDRTSPWGKLLDVTVARANLHPGDLAISIPDRLTITLNRVFEDATLAELLTTGKLSELACMTLYLM